MPRSLVPFYRLNRHLRFPLEKGNRYVRILCRYLTLVKAGHNGEAQAVADGLIAEWIKRYGTYKYIGGSNAIFWRFDPALNGLTFARGRCFPSGNRRIKNDRWLEEITKVMRKPNKFMGPPPPNTTLPGRCNFKGKPVFYGSFQDFTCMAELRPVVAANIVLAEFEATRPINFFRTCAYLERIQMEPENSDDPSDLRNMCAGTAEYERASFLYHLDLWLGFPLLVPHKHAEYLARRMIVRAIRKKIDCGGLEFTSSQIEGENIVIFPIDRDHSIFPLKLLKDSLQRCWVTDRPTYAEDVT